MKRLSLISLVVLSFFSCTKPSAPLDIKNLNGYWEIKEVQSSNANKKTFNVNSVVNYIELTSDSSAIRKKLIPTITGRYIPIGTYETLTLNAFKDSIVITSKTNFSSHKEVVETLNDSILNIKTNNTLYLYKRYSPITL